jgi:hypothetical protein
MVGGYFPSFHDMLPTPIPHRCHAADLALRQTTKHILLTDNTYKYTYVLGSTQCYMVCRLNIHLYMHLKVKQKNGTATLTEICVFKMNTGILSTECWSALSDIGMWGRVNA